MKLKSLYIEIEKEYQSGICAKFHEKFNKNVTFISEYFCAKLNKLKFDTENFNSICIHPNVVCHEVCKYDKSKKCIHVYVNFDNESQEKYYSMRNWNERHEVVLRLIEDGLRIANNYYDIPFEELILWADEFRQKNYEFKWLFGKGKSKKHQIYIEFICSMTHCYFKIDLEAYDLKKSNLLAKGNIIKRIPFYVYYRQHIYSSKVDENNAFILDCYKLPSFEIDIKMLSQGLFNKKCMGEYVEEENRWLQCEIEEIEYLDRFTNEYI